MTANKKNSKNFARKNAVAVKKTDGVMQATIGTPAASTPNEFVMVMIWDNIESINRFSGENWQAPVILPEEEHLIKETFTHHYEYYEPENPKGHPKPE